ncbi:hypothetical protein MVEG_01029 [Podila verticillata NRRL 6337]|nr:hypothetical protein MVEG_01029 [Podila verticillata NRRL 6337]
MRSAIILLALAVLVQVRACATIGIHACIGENTNCAFLKACIHDLTEVCVNFPEYLNDQMTHFTGHGNGRTQVIFYEHYDCQGARLESGSWRDVPHADVWYKAPYAKQASSVRINYYISPY